MKESAQTSFTTGMYLLETITSGMYNNPLMIFREYIQNAVDAIDLTKEKGVSKVFNIFIELDPIEQTIIIKDNAHGLSASLAKSYLNSIGASPKIGSSARGFRGIGRLGGIAFCDEIIFRTSGLGQRTVTQQTWNCKKLRTILAESKNTSMTIASVIKKTVHSIQERAEQKNKSFFEIKLKGVHSYKNVLLDYQRVKKYIEAVAPLPFNREEFKHSGEVKKFLKRNVPKYATYNIFLNGDPLFKPYKNIAPVVGKVKHDNLMGVKFFELRSSTKKPIAFGWLGIRKDMKGAIKRGNLQGGIKVRVGDMLVGDSTLLNNYFREARFNHYAVGEVHVISKNLILNGRRDDFIDNEFKSDFYNEFERVVGLPISKEIRQKTTNLQSTKSLSVKPSTLKKGNSKQKNHLIGKEKFSTLFQECGGCHKLGKISRKLEEGLGCN